MTSTKRKAQQKMQEKPLDPAIELARAEKAKRAAKKSGKVTTEAKAAPEVVNKGLKQVKEKAEPKPRPVIKGYSILKSGKMSARGLTCLCGCGQPTMTNDARFLPGHDAKLRQRLLAGEKIPAIIKPFFDHGETIAGLWLNEEGDIEDVKASKGFSGESEE